MCQLPFEIINIWDQKELAVSNWILFLSGANQPEEMEIATILLLWNGIVAKDSAQTKCMSRQDGDVFRCCSSHFSVIQFPCLVLSDSPKMDSFIKIEHQILFSLIKERGELQRFFARIHASLEHGSTLQDLQEVFKKEHFWSNLKLVYNELKGFFSIFLSANTGVG